MELLKILAQMVDCFASLYMDKPSIQEVTTQAGINKLELDLNGSPRDKWFNIIQHLSYNDPKLIASLFLCAMEANSESTCLQRSAAMIGVQNKDILPSSPIPSGSSTGGLLRELLKDDTNSMRGGLGNILGNLLGGNSSSNIFRHSDPPKRPKPTEQTTESFLPSASFNLMEQSLAVGLVKKNGLGSSTGFLISPCEVLLTTFPIQKPEDITELTIEFKNPLSDKNLVFKFAKIITWEPSDYILIAELEEEISTIPPLSIANSNQELTGEAVLISYSNLNKSITTVSNIKINNKNLDYNTYSSAGSAGGPVLLGNKVIGMHHSGSVKTEEKRGLAVDLTKLTYLDQYKNEN